MSTFLYNPDRKPKKELISEFVVRTDIFDEIMTDLETSKMKHPEQHYLLVGQRGAGKTTLLNRLKYAIEDSPKLKDKVIPILFSEEQYNISELVNLWESMAQYLEDYHDFEGLYAQMEALQDKANFEELSFDLLEKSLKKRGKKLILLIDNIGDLLKKLEKIEVHRLRSLMQTHSEIRLIAGSPFYLDTVLDYKQPLFEFFKVMQLDGLTREEAEALLKKLAETHGEKEKINKIITETPERVEVLRKLTGSVPRTIALMYNIFVEYNNEDTVKDLEKILDAVTPLYKHRMDDLPTQQQKIIDAVAKSWDGVNAKELAETLRIESKTISAQLRQLEKNQVVDIVHTGTKNHLYMLRERFFNIWYLMRFGRRSDKRRVIWLVKFLENWCTETELEQRIIDYVRKIQSGKHDDMFIEFFGELYTSMEKLNANMKILLKRSTPQHLSKKIEIADEEIMKLAQKAIDTDDHEEVFALFSELADLDARRQVKIGVWAFQLVIDDTSSFDKVFASLKKNLEGKDRATLTYPEAALLFAATYWEIGASVASGGFEHATKLLMIVLEQIRALEGSGFEAGSTFFIGAFLRCFLYFGQPHTVANVFTEIPDLKDKMKPIYFATLKLIGEEKESLKMSPEIQMEVNSLLDAVANLKTGKTG